MSAPIAVVGGGPVGLVVALAFAAEGVPVLVLEADADGVRAEWRGSTLHPPTLELLDLSDARSGARTSGRKLAVSCTGNYFDLLHSQRMLAINDTLRDPRTHAKVAGYFAPQNVGATIDVGLQARGGLIGCRRALLRIDEPEHADIPHTVPSQAEGEREETPEDDD